MVGLVVSGFAYEKLSDDMSRLAVLGFTASIVHAAAWWFTMGVTSPLKKFVACVLLFVGAMLSASVGRYAFLTIGEQPYLPLLSKMKFIASVVPVWWLSLAVINGVAKESIRWRLHYKGTPISPRTSLADMFQLTAIVGVVLAFFSSSVLSLVGSDYITMLLISVCLHAFMLVPLSMLILSEQRRWPSRMAFMCVVVVGFCGLLLLASSRYFGDEFESVSDVAVGFSAFIVPNVLMLLWGRENGLSLSSGWFKDP